jgi:hypothetical protein
LKSPAACICIYPDHVVGNPALIVEGVRWMVVAASVGSGKLDPSWALIIGGVAGAGVAGMTRHD